MHFSLIQFGNLFAIPRFSYFDVSELFDSLDAAMYAYISGDLTGYSVGDFTTSQITDTTNTDVLSSSNEIASDASVTGPMTLYLPDEATLVDLIDQYNNESITYDQLIDALGLSSVASDATEATKQDALASVATFQSISNRISYRRFFSMRFC